jgi:AcrR family transcriptional regulator
VVFAKRRDREKEIRRNTILKVARKLFFQRGFKNVTVESIAKKAELSKGLIYLYFNSKEELCTYILIDEVNKFQGISKQLFKNGKRASELLVDLSTIYVNFFLSDPELFRILITFMLHTDDMNLSEGLYKNIIKATNQAISIIEQILQYGVDKGEFPHSVNLRVNRNAIWGLFNGIIALHLFTGNELNREDLIRSTIRLGLLTYIKGLKVIDT